VADYWTRRPPWMMMSVWGSNGHSRPTRPATTRGSRGAPYEEDWFFTDGWNNRVEDDAMLADPYDREEPDFTPGSGSPLLTGARAPPNDGFSTMTDFIGAAGPGGTARVRIRGDVGETRTFDSFVDHTDCHTRFAPAAGCSGIQLFKDVVERNGGLKLKIFRYYDEDPEISSWVPTTT